MRRTLCALALVLVTVSGSRAAAQILYAATGSNGVAGQLFTINPATAASTLVGPTVIGASPIGLTGLAVHPTTGVLYGATGNSGPATNIHSLVTINPATGAATLIGSMLDPVGDIAFDAGGTLYGWQTNATPKSLVKIDLATGLQTQIGVSGLTNTSGNGLSFKTGTLFLAANGSNGGLRTVDPASGLTTVVAGLTGAPQAGAIAALAVDPSGVLFGANTNQGISPTTCNLVSIDTATGAVTNRGLLPADTDAIAFTNGAVGAAPGSFFVPVTPCRVLDTRNPTGPLGGPALGPGTARIFTIVGTCNVPAGAVTVSVNVTVTDQGTAGSLNLYAGDISAPATTVLSFGPGKTRANNALVSLSSDGAGTIAIRNSSAGSADVILDVNGYFP